jgi:hypothetical protein
MAEIGTSDKMQALYDRGNTHEEQCIGAMYLDGWDITDPGIDDLSQYENLRLEVDEDQWSIVLHVAGARITGHLDGITVGRRGEDPRPRVLEIKSPISWAKWERAHKTGDYSDPLMNRYAWQISVYMVATGLEAVVACVKDGQVRTFGIEVPPHSRDEIAERVAFMETAVRSEASNPVAMLACSQADYPCPVAYLHDRAEVVEDEALERLQASYSIWKRTKDQADGELKSLREAIDAHLGLSESLTTAAGTATRVTTTRTTYDTKAAIADGVDLTAYAKTSTSTSVRVTPRSPEPTIDGDPTGA